MLTEEVIDQGQTNHGLTYRYNSRNGGNVMPPPDLDAHGLIAQVYSLLLFMMGRNGFNRSPDNQVLTIAYPGKYAS